MACFEDLPVELMVAVILDIPLRDLSNLSKTSKRIRVVSLPALFRKIDFQWNSGAPLGPPVTALLRSILDNPELGKYIKEMNLRAIDYRGFQAPGFNGDILLPTHTHRIPAAAWETFEKALQTCPCEEKGECDDPTTREGNLNAGIGVLISYCTRVESLNIDIELLMHNYRLPAMLRSTLYHSLGPWGKQSWFGKLIQVTITYTDAQHRSHIELKRNMKRYARNLPVPTQTFLHLFYLPSLEILDVMFFPDISFSEGIQPDTLRHTVWPFPQAPMAFHLTTLQLRRSSALPATLKLLLAATPRLNSLHYDLFIATDQTPVCLHTLRQALQRTHRTLKSLAIRIEVHGDPDNDQDDDPISQIETSSIACVNTLGSLREFQALSSLEISFAVIYGQAEPDDAHPLAELLPPNLEHLVIVDDLWGRAGAWSWNNVHVLQTLRLFLAGQSLDGEVPRDASSLGDRDLDWNTRMEPQWRRATPKLSELVLDFEQRAWAEDGFLHRASEREALERVCEAEGISCDIKYAMLETDDFVVCSMGQI